MSDDLKPLAEALARWTEQHQGDPAAWWSEYGQLLLTPLAAKEPPRSVSFDEDGNRHEGRNLLMEFRCAQGDARRAGWDGRPDGWTDERVNLALKVERGPWNEWYDPIADRFRELARTVAALETHQPEHWALLAGDLLDQGDRMEAKLREWMRSGLITWLPFVRGAGGEGYPTVLHAWRQFSERWRAGVEVAA